jgi:hypothetical protein
MQEALGEAQEEAGRMRSFLESLEEAPKIPDGTVSVAFTTSGNRVVIWHGKKIIIPELSQLQNVCSFKTEIVMTEHGIGLATVSKKHNDHLYDEAGEFQPKGTFDYWHKTPVAARAWSSGKEQGKA